MSTPPIKSTDFTSSTTASNTSANAGSSSSSSHPSGPSAGGLAGLAVGKDEVQMKNEKDAEEGREEAARGGQGRSSGGKGKEPPRDPTGIIDMEILDQVLEMDEEEEDDEGEGSFSKSIVFGYFDQAGTTFEGMKTALAEKDLPTLFSLGHFLKGSSAALGVTKVKDSCEKMQHYGNKRDEEAGKALSETEALTRIRNLLEVVEEEYDEAAKWLKRYYREKEEGA